MADDETPETREQVRRDHALRIGEKLDRDWKELGFDNRVQAGVLGEICRGHRPKKEPDGHASWDDVSPVAIIGVDKFIRMRLISATIYAIDELHIGADRAPKRIQDWRGIKDEESRRHWFRHQAIEGPTRLPDGLVGLEIRGTTPGFEEDLRTHVLAKALGAIRDARELSNSEGVTSLIPKIAIGSTLPGAIPSSVGRSFLSKWIRSRVRS